MNKLEYHENQDFSIVLGGPFFQLLRKAHLTGNALELIKKRTLIISMVAWLPLLILSIINGRAWGDSINLPFIEDIEVHIRFLVAMPLMVVAELIVHQRMRLVVNQFQERNLIPEHAVNQFQKAFRSAFRLRNSIFAEVLILVIIYVIGYKVVWQQSMAIDTTAWYSQPDVGKSNLSLAGVWFRYLSLPLFQFLFLRWYYRIFIWSRFLFHISRIKMKLVPTHPDHLGGLGFLSNTVFAFMPLAFAHGVMLSGMIANHIFHDGASLLDFKIEAIIIVSLILCVVILPLFFFSSQLSDTNRMGTIEYGKFASRYAQAFDTQKATDHNPLSDTQAIQGLADLSNSYRIVEKMQIIPIIRNDMIMLAVITIAPVLPLVLTMMPLSELIKILSGVLF